MRSHAVWHRPNLRTTRLRQPALAPPVMLALAERFAPALGHAEIELLDVLVLAQCLGLAVEHHAAVLQHIAVTRVLQRHAGILLREQERHRLLGVEIADDLENLLDQLRREPHRRFVQQDRLRPRHQRASNRTHLLFAAGDISGGGAAPFLQPREIGIDQLEVAPDGRAAVAARERAGEKVLLHGEVREAMAPLHHLDASASHELVRGARMHLFAVEDDGAFGHFAALGGQKIGDRLERGRFAGAVRAQQRHDLALGNLERHPLEHEDDVIVDYFDIVDREDGRSAWRRSDTIGGRARAQRRRRWRRLLHIAIWMDRHQLVTRHPGVSFFSAAYFAAASLTMGAITLSSLVYQSDEIFQSLPSQVWMRPVRAPSWSSQDTLIGFSSFSKPSCLSRSADRLRFSRPQRTCSPVMGFLPNRSCAVRIASTPSMALINPRT